MPTCLARNTSAMPPADSRRTILYLPRIVSSAATAAVAFSPACATLASVIARDRISSRCEITLALAGGTVVLAFCSGSSASADSLLPVLPPHVVQTCAPNCIGNVTHTLSYEVRRHSMQPYGTSTDATAMFRARVSESPAAARNDSLTSTSVTAGTWPASVFSSRRHSFWPAESTRETSARSITTSPSAPTRNGRARNIVPIVPMMRKYVTEPWTSLMIRGGFSAAVSDEV
jgi:hypothetical protein